MKQSFFAILSMMFLSACGSENEEPKPTQAEPVVEMPMDGPFADFFDDGGYLKPDSHALILREVLFFGVHEEDGSLEGFDLDETVSDQTDAQTCSHPDNVDAEGRSGIDNQMGMIWNHIVGPLVGEATHALIKGAINEGRLLLAIELSDVDNLQNDDDVTLTFFRARRPNPQVGTFDLLAPDQTFYVDKEVTATRIENLAIKDGELTAGPVEFQVPIDILAEFFIVKVRSGKIRLTIEPDGSATGILGGVINVSEVLEEGYQTNAEPEFRLVAPIFYGNTDMLPNEEGGCDGISTAFRFQATTGFVVHYDDQREAN